MKKHTKLIITAGIILLGHGARANVLQIKECKEHLAYISKKRAEAQAQYNKAKNRLKALKQAENAQSRVVSSLLKADKKKQIAEAKALEAERIESQYDSYLSDNYHASGAARVAD